MRLYRIIPFLLTLLLLTFPFASATEGTIKLLAVAENGEGVQGSPAELYLEVRPGEGRVFIESFPAAKLDTQISTRFANQIACKFVGANCENYDFFYTIKAKSTIIGGPSAGAAVAVLTSAVLEGLPINQSVAMTGTINSGELIGPVGYVPAKMEAARAAGITKVLVPFEKEELDGTNVTINLTVLGNELGIELKQVTTLAEAVKEFTGKDLSKPVPNIKIDPAYAETMQRVAEQLCARSRELRENLNQSLAEAANLTARGLALLESERSYSAASQCFGANLLYTKETIVQENADNVSLRRLIAQTQVELIDADVFAEREQIETITDLETYMVVKDRLQEAATALNSSTTLLEKGNQTEAIDQLAYAIERVNSAVSWSAFFDTPGKKLRFSEDRLERSCTTKISEAQEHLEYLQLFFPEVLPGVQEGIGSALEDYRGQRYVLCLHKATLAKAEVNSVLGGMGIDEEELPRYIDSKLQVAQRIIAQDQADGMFPILGYSYYMYAQDLQEDRPYAALLYAEYALELSNLDIYFPKTWSISFSLRRFKEPFLLLAGILLGFLIARHVQRHRRKVRR